MTSVTTEILDVTPALAREWLNRNKRNRNLRPADVSRYARDMIAGRWHFTGEAIKFSKSNILLDGQHRLSAVVEAGIPVKMLVIWGLEDPAQHVMDSGVKRTAADALGLAGVKNTNLCAAGAKLAMVWESGLMFRDNKMHRLISTPEIEDWLARHPEFHASVSRITTIKNKVECSPSAMVVAHWKFNAINPVDCEMFFTGLATLANLDSGNAILALHRRLAEIRRNRITTSQRDYLALLITAWNRWRKGRSISKLQKPAGARWTAENFPVPQ